MASIHYISCFLLAYFTNISEKFLCYTLPSMLDSAFNLEGGLVFVFLGLLINSARKDKTKLSIYFIAFTFVYFLIDAFKIVPLIISLFNRKELLGNMKVGIYMGNIERTQRLAELRIENERKQLIARIAKGSEGIVVKSFISVLETEKISKKVYERIDASSNHKTIDKDVQTILGILSEQKQEFTIFLDKDVILLHQLDRETGAIILKLKSIFENLKFIMHFVGYSQDYRDLIIVSPNMEFGICSERYEYENVLTIWR